MSIVQTKTFNKYSVLNSLSCTFCLNLDVAVAMHSDYKKYKRNVALFSTYIENNYI